MANLSVQSEILLDIAKERERQESLKKAGKFPWTDGDDSSRIVCLTSTNGLAGAGRLAVLAEEFGEVSQLVCETMIDASRYQPRELKKELIQVAAVALAWIESIDRDIDEQVSVDKVSGRPFFVNGIDIYTEKSNKSYPHPGAGGTDDRDEPKAPLPDGVEVFSNEIVYNVHGEPTREVCNCSQCLLQTQKGEFSGNTTE